MKHPSAPVRLPAKLFVGWVLAGIGCLTLRAELIFSEAFEFGEGIPLRESVVEGDAFESGPVQEGGTEWNVGGSQRSRTLEYIEGGGIRFVQAINRGNASLQAPLPAEAGGKRMEAIMEFIPGTLWGEPIKGMWMGLLEDTDQQRLMANTEEGTLVAARMGFSRGNTMGFLQLKCDSDPNAQSFRSNTFPIDPHALYRMILRIEPASLSAEAVLEDDQGAVVAELRGVAPELDRFHNLKIDMTSLKFDEFETPPVIKRVSLTAE